MSKSFGYQDPQFLHTKHLVYLDDRRRGPRNPELRL